VSTSSNQPILSIITVAAYDSERLATTLESLIAISTLDVEHITVTPRDDLHARTVWQNICEGLPNFKQVSDGNEGIYSAMNLGSRCATGKFLVFWNAGEKITNYEQVSRLIERLRSSDSPQLISQAEIEWLPGNIQDLDSYLGFLSGQKSKFISHQSYFVSREHFLKQGGFSAKFKVASDTEFILRMSRFGIEFSEDIKPVWVENSNFASLNHRLGRLENLQISIRYLFKKRFFLRLPKLILSEISFVLRAAARLFEVSARHFKFVYRDSEYHFLQFRKNRKISYGRARVTSEFSKAIDRHLLPNVSKKVGVIGGSLDDYEVSVLRRHSPKAEFTVLGIEGSDVLMDLNQPFDRESQFDLVLVSQVLEHIWNHESFFSNVISCVKKDGFIWVGCPASNKVHASPDFFSAGFTHQFLQHNFESRNVHSVLSGSFGSKRLYVATHLIPGWLTPRGHSFPLFFGFEDRTFLSRILLWARYFPYLVYLSFVNAEDSSSDRWLTESWWFGRK
jgi:SAM-dependent methyltransferase